MGYGSYVTDGLYTDPLDSLWGGGGGGVVLEMITGTLYTVYSYIHTQYLFSVDSQSVSWTPFSPDHFTSFVAGLSCSPLHTADTKVLRYPVANVLMYQSEPSLIV